MKLSIVGSSMIEHYLIFRWRLLIIININFSCILEPLSLWHLETMFDGNKNKGLASDDIQTCIPFQFRGHLYYPCSCLTISHGSNGIAIIWICTIIIVFT